MGAEIDVSDKKHVSDYVGVMKSLQEMPQLAIYPLQESVRDGEYYQDYPSHPDKWSRKFAEKYQDEGILMSCSAVIVVHDNNAPGVLFIKNQRIESTVLYASYHLPSVLVDREMGIKEASAVLHKYIKERIGEGASGLTFKNYLGNFYRVTCNSPLLPYLPAHTCRPVEVQLVFLLELGPLHSLVRGINEKASIIKFHELPSIHECKNVTFPPAYRGISNMLCNYKLVMYVKENNEDNE